MSLPDLNVTQQAQVLEVLFKSTASSAAPPFIFESFMLGSICTYIPLGLYTLWIKSTFKTRVPYMLMLCVALSAAIVHWTLSLRQLETTFTGSPLEISLTLEDLETDVANEPSYNFGDREISGRYALYQIVWGYLLPLVVETTLFGFASGLYAITAYVNFWQYRSERQSRTSLLIPGLASLMYAMSLTHWAIFLQCYTLQSHGVAAIVDGELPTNDVYTLGVALLALLSFNTVISDSIVLWRMCVVWDRARPMLVMSAILLVTTLGLNIANIVGEAHGSVGGAIIYNYADTELVPTYGQSFIGLATVFISMASNLFATTLVGIKFWLHRTRVSKYLRSSYNGRTLVERLLELLLESGVVYSVIWTLYCIGFFRKITSQTIVGPATDDPRTAITAVTYLDAAMAQITSIYPLIVFILVAIDKLHHKRALEVQHNVNGPKERRPPVSLTPGIDVERGLVLSPNASYPTAVPVSYVNDGPSVSDRTDSRPTPWIGTSGKQSAESLQTAYSEP
ncbi:unnamed protein product [Peniophora sp. CBMAI 1063]|nr:unnamed protein product [Peniophora sp. CBMAI 1063]